MGSGFLSATLQVRLVVCTWKRPLCQAERNWGMAESWLLMRAHKLVKKQNEKHGTAAPVDD